MRFMMRLKNQIFILLLALLPSSAFPQCTRCGPAVSVSPKSLVFGSQAVGTRSAPKVITVTNMLPIAVRLAVSTTGPFQSAGCSGGLGGHKSCAISVTFTPVTPGPAAGATNISDGTPVGHFKVQLSGTGVTAMMNESKNVATTVLSAASLPSTEPELMERENSPEVRNSRSYRFIDLGTFGGPNSETNGSTVVIGPDGAVVGEADTDAPCPYLPESPISPAFKSKGNDKRALATFRDGCTGFPIAIGPTGLIVGSADPGIFDSDGVPEIRAALWKGRHIVNLGTLGGDNSLAVAVNSHGQIVGLSANAVPDESSIFGWKTQTRTFLWEKGVMQDLGTLGGPDSAGGLINERGQIAGSSYTSNIPNPIATFCGENIPPENPFLWESGKMTNLGSLGGTCGIAAVLNNRGEVVGFSDLEGDHTGHPFLWRRGKMTDLGTLGGTFGIAGWINDSEEIVGASTTADDEFLRGFLWRHGQLINLGSLDGDDCSDAFVVNARGQVIGPSFDCNDPENTHAYLWDNGRMFDLNAFVPPGLSLQLADPHYINDSGEIAVVGMLPDGTQHAIVLVPCSGSGEEGCREAAEDRQAIGRMPSTAALVAAGKRTGFDPKTIAAKSLGRRKWISGMRGLAALHK